MNEISMECFLANDNGKTLSFDDMECNGVRQHAFHEALTVCASMLFIKR